MENTENRRKPNYDKLIVRLLLWTSFSLFLFSQPRYVLSHGMFNSFFNILFIGFGSFTLGTMLLNEGIDLAVILMTMVFMCIAFITLVAERSPIYYYPICVTTLVMPFLITGFRLPNSLFEQFMERFIKGINVVVFLLVAIGVIDYLSNASIQMYFAQHNTFGIDQSRLIITEHQIYGIYRYYSFVGHPLTNAWYLLMFYTMNIAYNKYFRPLINEYLLIGTMIIGLVLCGSRSALVIGLFMCLFLNNRKYKLPFMGLIAFIGAGFACTPLFQNNLKQRFIESISSGSFSEGRNEAVQLVLNHLVKTPQFFIGGGLGNSLQITLNMGGFIKSFEYPFMMFAYDLGILGALLIYLLIFIIPTIVFMKNKAYLLLTFFWLISLYMNGFNDLANYSDSMGQFCFFIMVMLNMSYVKKSKWNEERLRLFKSIRGKTLESD